MRKSQPTLSPQQISSPTISIEKLQKALEVEAKKANTRLRAIEKAGKTKPSKAYKAIRTFAKDNRQFIKKDKTGNIRFNRGIKGRSREDIQEELQHLYTFNYRAKTSTISGINKTQSYIKLQTQRQNATGTKSQAVMDFFGNMSQDDFDDFWDNENIKRIYDLFGSDETIEIIETAKGNKHIGKDLELLDMAINDIINNSEKSIETMSQESLEDLITNYKPPLEITD